jgi:hypothetical protein
VGAVFALEVSRLARSNLDWHRLLELCALTDTLVIDEDGCYNPGDFNDGLLLGLKRPGSYCTSCSTFLRWKDEERAGSLLAPIFIYALSTHPGGKYSLHAEY